MARSNFRVPRTLNAIVRTYYARYFSVSEAEMDEMIRRHYGANQLSHEDFKECKKVLFGNCSQCQTSIRRNWEVWK